MRVIIAMCLLAACSNQNRPAVDLTRYVDPLIGTRGEGNAVPGPCVPHGMVKLSPDTDAEEGSIDAYDFDHGRIEGFSHTHLEGPGGSHNGYSQVLLMPRVGAVRTVRQEYASPFDHATEVVSPGYYSVVLADSGIQAELSATRRCGVHRYTFPAAMDAHVLVDLAHTRGEPVGGHVEVVGADTVRGRAVHQVNPLVAWAVGDYAPGTTGVSTVYFVVRASRKADSFGTWADGVVAQGVRVADGEKTGAYLSFATKEGEVITFRVGVSFISEDEAEKAMAAECDRPFEAVRAEAVALWNRLLSRVEIEGGTEDDKRIFYTALYHSFMQPADYTEGDRFWSGADGFGKVVQPDGWRYYTDDWCMWDTFRTTHPLIALLEPEVVNDMVRSLVHTYEASGWMQKCTWNATGDSRVMTGNPQFCVVADAVAKGLATRDLDLAFKAMEKGANEDEPHPLSEGACGYVNRGTPKDYVDLGYVSYECDRSQSASMTLEYAYADACVAVVAEAIGGEAADFYRKRSLNWRNVFDPSVGMARVRLRNGSWLEPFDPTAEVGFTEANSWQYTWSVQQDVCGLVAAMGGREAFSGKLEEFFSGKFFTISNEPDFHAPWLFDFVGKPSRTAAVVAETRQGAFGKGPDGLPGNDDAGATSAFYVFAAMGLYPVTPGDNWYYLNTPAFDRIPIHLKGKKTFVIEAPGASTGLLYPRAVRLNGRALAEPRVRYEDVVKGGVLEFELADRPDDSWAHALCP